MINIEIILPTKLLLQGEYDHIIIPGVDGDFGVDKDHTPFITKIRSGIMTLYKGKDESRFVIHDGFVTVENNSVRIICDVIENEKEVNLSRAEEAKQRAEKRLKANTEDIDIRRAEAALKRALARLSIQSKDG